MMSARPKTRAYLMCLLAIIYTGCSATAKSQVSDVDCSGVIEDTPPHIIHWDKFNNADHTSRCLFDFAKTLESVSAAKTWAADNDMKVLDVYGSNALSSNGNGMALLFRFDKPSSNPKDSPSLLNKVVQDFLFGESVWRFRRSYKGFSLRFHDGKTLSEVHLSPLNFIN